jgi:hypothetical protein
MVWPCLKWSTDPETFAHPRSGTLRGRIYLQTPQGRRFVNFPSLPFRKRLKVIKLLDGYSSLKEDVQVKLAQASEILLRRIEEVWRAIEDCIILSSPELVGKPVPKFIWRLWKWCISNAIHSVDQVTLDWKQFCKFLQFRNADCTLNTPVEIPSGFPNSGKYSLGKEWQKTFPWLESSFRSSSKYLQEKLAHLANSRGCPCPSMDQKVLEKGFDNLRERLSRTWPVDQKVKQAVFDIGRTTAHFIKAGSLPSCAHVSMSAMASFDGPRNKGGRATEFCSSFIQDYIRNVADETMIGTTWFGSIYHTKEDRPKFETMCREFSLKEKNYDFLLSNFESGFTTPWDPFYKIEEPIIGVDAQLGYQMLQHSLEVAIERGFIYGSKWHIPGTDLRLSGKPIPVRAEPIGESGAKLRWITVGPAWENLLLQPLGHELIGLLEKDPCLKSGFQRSWKGYDFANDLAVSDLKDLKNYYIVQGDLEVATDNMNHEYVSSALKGFLIGADRSTPFMNLLVDLLCSPREVWRGGSPKFITKSGILMGDPGTKPALALMGKAARMLAYYRYCYENISLTDLFNQPYPKRVWDVYRVAGDDFIDIGPINYLKLLKECHQILGHRVGTFTYSKRVSRYCEEPLIFVDKDISPGKPLWKVTDYQSTIHVDSLKVRIFSPCGKASAGSNEDFKNPVIGKGQALERKLPWLPGEWAHLKVAFIKRWCFRMRDYVDLTEPYWFLPQSMGGVGLPNPYGWEYIIAGVYNRCPEYFTCTAALLEGNVPFWLNKVFQAMSAGGISRGSELDLRQAAHEGYVMSAEIAGYQKSQEQIAEIAGLNPDDFNHMPRGKRRQIAKDLGYTAEFDLDTQVEKAWLIKSAFQVAWRGEEVQSSLKERLPAKLIWNQLQQLINSSETRVLPSVKTVDEAQKLFLFLRDLKKPRETKHNFIHKDVLSRNFGALMTPLPGTKHDIAMVRGSTVDI